MKKFNLERIIKYVVVFVCSIPMLLWFAFGFMSWAFPPKSLFVYLVNNTEETIFIGRYQVTRVLSPGDTLLLNRRYVERTPSTKNIKCTDYGSVRFLRNLAGEDLYGNFGKEKAWKTEYPTWRFKKCYYHVGV